MRKPMTLKGWIISHPRFDRGAYTAAYHKFKIAKQALDAWSMLEKEGVKPRLVRVTVSVNDPRANRISAAERRVVEAAVTWVFNRGRKSPCRRVTELYEAAHALQRAKGGANG